MRDMSSTKEKMFIPWWVLTVFFVGAYYMAFKTNNIIDTYAQLIDDLKEANGIQAQTIQSQEFQIEHWQREARPEIPSGWPYAKPTETI